MPTAADPVHTFFAGAHGVAELIGEHPGSPAAAHVEPAFAHLLRRIR